jgi:ketosteroid isomerase-like protein
MHRQIYIALTLSLILIGCTQSKTNENMTQWKSEIIKVEQDFNDLAQKIGLADAFYKYAADDGVIRKSGKLVEGKVAIQEWIANDTKPNVTLTWKPTFVDVSQSGDLAYTYGDATYTFIDSLGTTQERTSVYHTVWKRQEDGNWRFVWD